MVADILPGLGSSLADKTPLAVANGRLFFPANDGTTGMELWTSDGTAAGTFRVADIAPGEDGSWPTNLAVATRWGRVVFSADDGTNGREPWASDGTAAGTVLLGDIAAGAASSEPDSFTASAANLFMVADDGVVGRELWKVDMPLAGAVPDGHPARGAPLLVTRESPGDIRLTWSASCVAADADYSVYQGVLGDYAGSLPALCSTSGQLTAVIPAAAGNVFYTVVPWHGTIEGSHGLTSSGAERPVGPAPCHAQAAALCF
jgi:ELWxxDGT repeat protein